MKGLKNISMRCAQEHIRKLAKLICGVLISELLVIVVGGSFVFAKEEVKKESSKVESKQEEKSLESKIFDKKGEYCKVVAKSFNISLAQYDPKLEALVKGILEDLKKRRMSSLAKKFHPRMKIGQYQVKTKIFSTLGSSIFMNPSYSLYRVWAIDSKSSGSSPVDCDGEYRMNPHYGYDIQFGVWIQVMSDIELGWIYTTIVPYKSDWVLASFDVRQLSSEGKQAEYWWQEARSDFEKELVNLSYLKFDVAKKLSFTGGYIYVKNLDGIQNDIVSYFGEVNPLLKLVEPYMEGRTLLMAESNFASNGVGLFIRYGVTWKESDNSLASQCRRIAKNLMDIKEFESIKGVKCSFSLPGEKLEIDGARGSLYIPRQAPRPVKSK